LDAQVLLLLDSVNDDVFLWQAKEVVIVDASQSEAVSQTDGGHHDDAVSTSAHEQVEEFVYSSHGFYYILLLM
jgi:hypothetical protein